MVLLKWILRRKILMLAMLGLILTANAQNLSYIDRHKTLTTELSEQFGIPYSVILAVAIVESASGEGKTAKKLKNHFGIVGHNDLKAKKGYRSRYKQYESDEDSFMDFCRMISRKEFYARLKDNSDSKEWISAMSRAGYSEKPKVWEKRILNTIATNRL